MYVAIETPSNKEADRNGETVATQYSGASLHSFGSNLSAPKVFICASVKIKQCSRH